MSVPTPTSVEANGFAQPLRCTAPSSSHSGVGLDRSDSEIDSTNPQRASTVNRSQRSSASIEFCGRAAALAFADSTTGPPLSAAVVGGSAMDADASISLSGLAASSEPTFLLLTQNIGGIDAASTPEDGAGANATASAAAATTSAATPAGAPSSSSGDRFMASPSGAPAPMDLQGENTTVAEGGSGREMYQSFWVSAESDAVMEQTKVKVAEFIADLRAWIHRVAVMTARRRQYQQQQQQQQEDKPQAATDSLPRISLSEYSTDDVPPQIDVIVLHLQEVGGKYMNKGFNAYIAAELRKKLLPEAGWTSGLLMDTDGGAEASPTSSSPPPADAAPLPESPTSPTNPNNNFTALGTIIFLSPRMANISSMFSFPHRTYIPIPDDPCSYGGTDRNVFKTAKFSAAGRSRKGYLLTSLRLGNCVFNTCNVHFFNDEDNVEALKRSPSKYVTRRTDAALEAVAESLSVVSQEEPFFMFGDTNVRLDGKQLADHLRATQQLELRPGKKELRCPESFWPPFYASYETQQKLRRSYDREIRHIADRIAQQTGMEMAEMPMGFAPTYSRLTVSLAERLQQRARAGVSGRPEPWRGAGQPAVSLRPSPQAAGHADPRERESTDGAEEGANHARSHKEEEGAPRNDVENAESKGVAPADACSSLKELPSATLVADRHRGNFTHERIPAWCDRIIFNPAALELIAGGRFASSRAREPQRDPGHDEQPGGDDEEGGVKRGRTFTYDAVSLLHTDHDGVFLTF